MFAILTERARRIPPGVGVMAEKDTEKYTLSEGKIHFSYRCTLAWIFIMCLLLVALGIRVSVIWYYDAIPSLSKEANFVTTTENYGHSGKNLIEERFSANLLVKSKSYCTIESCRTVTCKSVPAGMDAGKVAGNFIDTDYKKQCANSNRVLGLKFVDSKFPDNKLRESWLTIDVALSELTFENCQLIEIDENAFSTNIFNELTSLSIAKNQIASLSESIFKEFSNLQSLSICENRITQVDVNLLKYVGNTLQNLQLDQSIYDVEVLENITGKTYLPKVQILSLRDNKIDKITSATFQGVSNIQSLYLDRSGINTIDENAFEPFAKSIRQLNLSNNKITTISELLLNNILKYNSQFKLIIDNNPWNCDCDLEWIQNFIMDHPNIFHKIPNCQTPSQNADKSFVDAIFCEITTSQVSPFIPETTKDTSIVTISENSTTISQLPVITTTTNPTTQIPRDPNTVELICQDMSNWQKNSTILLSIVDYEFKSRYPEFSIKEIDDYAVLINLAPTNTSLTLIWYNSKMTHINGSTTECVICVKNIHRSYVITNLQPESSYVICLLVKDDRNPSPFNCLPLTTKPTYEARVWLTNRDKVKVILLLSLIVVSCCVVGALLSFFVIRKNPSLLRGSKRVMVVRHRTADAIVLPEGVKIRSRRSSEVLDFSNDSGTSPTTGYISPIGQKKPLIRKDSSTSGVSSHSSGTSYVSGIEPTVGQLMSWRIGRIRNKLSFRDVEVPPPLPPHPKHGVIPSLSLNVDAARDEECHQKNLIDAN